MCVGNSIDSNQICLMCGSMGRLSELLISNPAYPAKIITHIRHAKAVNSSKRFFQLAFFLSVFLLVAAQSIAARTCRHEAI